MNPKAEQIRLRYLYRTKLLRGEIKVPLGTAKKLVGPDCVYHLYSTFTLNKGVEDEVRSRRGKKSRNPGLKKGSK
jgi:hypothetical protein